MALDFSTWSPSFVPAIFNYLPCVSRRPLRVLTIIAGILMASHLKTTEDLFDNRGSPKTEARVAPAVQRAERIVGRIDNVFETARQDIHSKGIAPQFCVSLMDSS